MSVDERGGGTGRRFGRREFLKLGGAGAGAIALGGCSALAVGQAAAEDAFSYRGSRALVRRRGGRPEILIDGARLETVDSNGAYRAAGFVFSPQPTPGDLARRLVDYRIAMRG